MRGNGRRMGAASGCCAIWCTVYPSHLFYKVLRPAFLGCPTHFLSMTNQVRTFEGVCHVPLNVLRDPKRHWLYASWLSKQMKYINYKKYNHMCSMWHIHGDAATCSTIF